MGRCGVCARVVSAPTIAAVRMSSRLGGVTTKCGAGVMIGRGSGKTASLGTGPVSAGSTSRGRRWQSLGTTHVPSARHTTTGSASASAADGCKPGPRAGVTTFRASNAIARDVDPIFVTTPVASM
jgi:hypothetical protein